MIIENTTRRELRERWNRHLSQNVLEIKIGSEWCALGSIVVGRQTFEFGIIAETTLPRQVNRTPCDLQLARTVLREGC